MERHIYDLLRIINSIFMDSLFLGIAKHKITVVRQMVVIPSHLGLAQITQLLEIFERNNEERGLNHV